MNSIVIKNVVISGQFMSHRPVLQKTKDILRNTYDRCYIFELPLCFLQLFAVAFYLRERVTNKASLLNTLLQL